MSESLVAKLNTEKPNIEQTIEMLGHNWMGDYEVKLGDKYVLYYLKTPPFVLIGWDMYYLDLEFYEDGSFLSAEVILYK